MRKHRYNHVPTVWDWFITNLTSAGYKMADVLAVEIQFLFQSIGLAKDWGSNDIKSFKTECDKLEVIVSDPKAAIRGCTVWMKNGEWLTHSDDLIRVGGRLCPKALKAVRRPDLPDTLNPEYTEKTTFMVFRCGKTYVLWPKKFGSEVYLLLPWYQGAERYPAVRVSHDSGYDRTYYVIPWCHGHLDFNKICDREYVSQEDSRRIVEYFHGHPDITPGDRVAAKAVRDCNQILAQVLQ